MEITKNVVFVFFFWPLTAATIAGLIVTTCCAVLRIKADGIGFCTVVLWLLTGFVLCMGNITDCSFW